MIFLIDQFTVERVIFCQLVLKILTFYCQILHPNFLRNSIHEIFFHKNAFVRQKN